MTYPGVLGPSKTLLFLAREPLGASKTPVFLAQELLGASLVLKIENRESNIDFFVGWGGGYLEVSS